MLETVKGFFTAGKRDDPHITSLPVFQNPACAFSPGKKSKIYFPSIKFSRKTKSFWIFSRKTHAPKSCLSRREMIHDSFHQQSSNLLLEKERRSNRNFPDSMSRKGILFSNASSMSSSLIPRYSPASRSLQKTCFLFVFKRSMTTAVFRMFFRRVDLDQFIGYFAKHLSIL